MMLLIGMKINLTKNPTNPITTKPIAVRNATFVNSATFLTTITNERRNRKLEDLEHNYNGGKFHRSGVGTFTIWFVASFDEADAVPGEFSEWIDDVVNGIHIPPLTIGKKPNRNGDGEELEERESWTRKYAGVSSTSAHIFYLIGLFLGQVWVKPHIGCGIFHPSPK